MILPEAPFIKLLAIYCKLHSETLEKYETATKSTQQGIHLFYDISKTYINIIIMRCQAL